jgi:hypothetical protein
MALRMAAPLSSLSLLSEEKDETIFSMVASKPANEDATFLWCQRGKGSGITGPRVVTKLGGEAHLRPMTQKLPPALED